ncbi:MAG: hypothetical protein JWO10_2196 [Microbacteriaceae bacterium]|nr:hypothetical protein [Microbacteriaceae bacterium]
MRTVIGMDNDEQQKTDELRKIAKNRLKAQADFRNYLWIWLGVSVVLTGIWAFSGLGYFWPAWAIGGMGVAAFFTGLNAYGPRAGGITDSAIDAEVARMNQRRDQA